MEAAAGNDFTRVRTMNRSEFAARVIEMRADKPARCSVRALPSVKWKTAPTRAEVRDINQYFKQFMVPVLSESAVPVVICPCCKAHMFSGSPALDSMRSEWEGGVAAGEGFCRRCVYPIKMVHRLPGGRSLTYPLAYHPSLVRVDAPLGIGPRDIAARAENRRHYAGQKWLM
jgi:hypothetical protein